MDKIKLNVEEAEILHFQAHRIITNFYKEMLVMIEDLAEEHDDALCKLQDNLPDQYKKYVDLADYFPEEKSIKLRKRILDRGNDAIRQIEDQLKNFEIKIKTK